MENSELKIVKLSNEFGIEEKQASKIMDNLPKILAEREEIREDYEKVLAMDIEDPKASKLAKIIRLKIVNNRTQGIEAWHKRKKDVFLRGGQFVDAIKRDEIGVNKEWEEDLRKIEKHQEIKEQKRLAALQEERVRELSKYVDDANERQLSAMEDDVWEAYLSAKKKEYEERQLAAEEENRQKLIEENKRALRNNRREKLVPYWGFIAEKDRVKDFAEMNSKEFNEILEDAKSDSIKFDEIQEKNRLNDLRIKREEEEAKKLKSAPDKDKLNKAIDSLSLPSVNDLTKESEGVLRELEEKLEAYKKWSRQQIEKL